MFMAMARAASMRSTCYRLNVGCVIVKKHDVISVGYNGAPASQQHCTGNGCKYYAETGCQVIHAEANAIVRALHKDHWSLVDSKVYCTHSPCNACIDLMLGKNPVVPWNGNPSAIYYETEYRDTSSLDRLIRETTIGLFRIQPSGYLIDRRTGGLCDPNYEV